MTSEELHSLIQGGENNALELKTGIPRPDDIARQLASMANTRGGVLILGVKEPAEYSGVDAKRAEAAIRSAERLLSPQHPITIETVEAQGRSIVVASVVRSDKLISAHGGFYRRVGDNTQALTADEIKSHALAEGSPDSALSKLSAAVAAQTQTIDQLRVDFEKANSMPRKVGIALVGAAAGAIAKSLIDLWLK
jgi:predicted HTH transcriptional regulator